MTKEHMPSTTPSPNFWDVKAILDWLTNHRTTQQLQNVHGTSFGWDTRQMLLDAEFNLQDGGPTFQLIQADMIGNEMGRETNLIKALRDRDGVGGNKQMPLGGNGDRQYATPLQIEIIIRWIDAGCPE